MGLGKWIAGALGWAILGPIGGILSFYFASRAEEASDAQGEQVRLQGERNSFLMSLLVLSAAIIRVDRKASYEEIIKLQDFFRRNFVFDFRSILFSVFALLETLFFTESINNIAISCSDLGEDYGLNIFNLLGEVLLPLL